MTRSGKENKQGGVLLRKLSKVHKKMCQESVRERNRGNVRVETGFGICLQARVTCCLTNGERKAFYASAFFHQVKSSCSQASWPALVKLFKRPVSACERQSCLCCSKALGSELPRGRDAWAFLLPGAFAG